MLVTALGCLSARHRQGLKPLELFQIGVNLPCVLVLSMLVLLMVLGLMLNLLSLMVLTCVGLSSMRLSDGGGLVCVIGLTSFGLACDLPELLGWIVDAADDDDLLCVT